MSATPVISTHAAHLPAGDTKHFTTKDTQHQPGGHVHVVPGSLLLTIYFVLVLLTVLTVAIAMVDLGVFNIWVALAIAIVKASLVVMYFMHLRWDSPFNGIVLIAALFFVVLFIGTAITDSNQYKENFNPPASGEVLRGQFQGVRNYGR